MKKKIKCVIFICFLLFSVTVSSCGGKGGKNGKDDDNDNSYNGPIKFDLSGSVAIGTVKSTGKKNILSTIESIINDSKSSDNWSLTNKSENDSVTGNSYIKKITEENTIENIIQLPSNYELPPVKHIAFSPKDRGLYIIFDYAINYKFVDDNNNEVNENLGSVLYIKPDNTYIPLFPDNDDIVSILTSRVDNLELISKIIDLDNNGNSYFLLKKNSGEDKTLYMYNPITNEKTIIPLYGEPFYWCIDPTGKRLFVTTSVTTSDELSFMLHMYPLDNISHPLEITDSSAWSIQGKTRYSNVRVAGMDFSPDGESIMINFSTFTPTYFHGIARIDIISDTKVSIKYLYQNPDYYYLGYNYEPASDDLFSIFNSLYILMTDGINYFYVKNNLSTDSYNSSTVGIGDELNSTEKTIGTDIWFAEDKTDPARKSDSSLNSLEKYMTSGKMPFFYNRSRFVDGQFYELPSSVESALQNPGYYFTWSNNCYSNGTYGSDINADMVLQHFTSMYAEEAEFRWGSKTGNDAIIQAFNESPYTDNMIYGADYLTPACDPSLFLKNHIFKTGTSENPLMCKDIVDANSSIFSDRGDFGNVTQFYYSSSGEVYGIMNGFRLSNDGTYKNSPIPVRLLNSEGEKDIKLIGKNIATIIYPDKMLFKNDYLYFTGYQSSTYSGTYRLYRIKLDDPSLSVEDVLINANNGGIVNLINYTIDDEELYFSGNIDSTPVLGRINLQTLEYSAIDTDVILTQLESYN